MLEEESSSITSSLLYLLSLLQERNKSSYSRFFSVSTQTLAW